MAANVVFSAVEHALAYVAVQIWVVVVYYPLSLGYRLRVCEGMVVGGNQLIRFRDVFPVDILGYGAEGDYWAREQQELIDGRRGIADERICHQLIFGYVLSLVDEENILLGCSPFTVFIYPFLAGKRMELHYYQGIALLRQLAQLFLDVRKRSVRKRFGINVLGVKRGGSSSSSSEGGRGGNEYITDNLIAAKLHVGDMLLVQGEWTNLTHLTADTTNWVVLDQPEKAADKVLLDYKAPVAAAIMLLMIAMMVFDFIPVAPVTAVIIAGLLTVFAGCFRNVEAAYKTINWESIVLIAAMMPMSTALEKTGASALVSQGLVDSLGAMGPTALLARFLMPLRFG